MLANLYNEKKDVIQALQTERQLLSITQDETILKRMQRRFEYFFITSQNPINRIVVYNECKELMPTGIRGVQIKERLLHDFITLDLLDKAYDLAMELTQTTAEQKQQPSALYAYLIANILKDTEKQNLAKEYLADDWKKQKLPDNTPEILKWIYRRIR